MYIVLEIQKQSDTQVATLTDSYAELSQAEQKYHTVLSYAAVSELPIHSAVLMDDSGYTLKNETYIHEQEENT